MALLLDTCTFLWLTQDPNRLSSRAQEAIEFQPEDLFVSAISALEFAVKISKKKLRLSSPEATQSWFRQALEHHGISQVPINFQIASQSGELSFHHKDPYDRLIIATAMEYQMTVVTPDRLVAQYDEIKCLW